MIITKKVELTHVDDDDLNLRLAIAREVFGYDQLHVSPTGRITLETDRPWTTVPRSLRNWTKYQVSAAEVEAAIRERNLWSVYLDHLRSLIGNENTDGASARQKCEAALSAVRGRTVPR